MLLNAVRQSVGQAAYIAPFQTQFRSRTSEQIEESFLPVCSDTPFVSLPSDSPLLKSHAPGTFCQWSPQPRHIRPSRKHDMRSSSSPTRSEMRRLFVPFKHSMMPSTDSARSPFACLILKLTSSRLSTVSRVCLRPWLQQKRASPLAPQPLHPALPDEWLVATARI